MGPRLAKGHTDASAQSPLGLSTAKRFHLLSNDHTEPKLTGFKPGSALDGVVWLSGTFNISQLVSDTLCVASCMLIVEKAHWPKG